MNTNYVVEDLVRIAKRENNTKRNYLVVDPLQAKHVPVSPNKALELFTALSETLKGKYDNEHLLIIGFAETATAIGAQVAMSLKMPYIQTTREIIEGVEYLFFSEEHSHATEQKLIKNDIDAAAVNTDRIVFVEDEVTTGKTILNIISILEKEYPAKFHYSVASLLNGMSEEHLNQYSEKNIDLLYLVKTDHSSYGEIADTLKDDGEYYISEIGEVDYTTLTVGKYVNTRRLTDNETYKSALEALCSKVVKALETVVGKNVLVMGTEECMYPALYVGARLEGNGCMVKCHSTTRSPIAVSKATDYPLHKRYELKSLYDEARKTFIYDIDSYDKVVIITDAKSKNEGELTLINALAKYNQDILLVRWC